MNRREFIKLFYAGALASIAPHKVMNPGIWVYADKIDPEMGMEANFL